jgi:Peptidase_C39 like family
MLHRRQLLALLALANLPLACDEPRPQTPAPTLGPAKGYASTRISGVPHVRQRSDFCGEAAAAAYLAALDTSWSQDDVFAVSGMPPARGMGATTRELRTALDHIGFDVGPTWHHVDPSRAAAELDVLWAQLHGDLVRGVPSIICMRYDERPSASEHFRLVLGYDSASDEVLYHEPAEDDGAYRRMPRTRLLGLWPLKYAGDRWTVIRLALGPGTLSAPPSFATHSPADFAQHVRELRERLPPGFSVVLEPPFVVVGDEPAATVQRRAESTVRWSVEKLQAAFFDKPPREILDVWLFRNAASYEGHASRLFGEKPDTPYGYYSHRDRALVMNIATGGGTLVHEIVHPYIESNFPACPAWFNEGLGSLFEQSADRDGRIVGLTNWRLAGLQRAIAGEGLPSLRHLTHTTTRAFYDDDVGTNYAQARYLLMYLQEEGTLRAFYRAFHAAQASDPTGYFTLQRTLGEKDMTGFQRRWERWVLGLRFRS